MIAQATKDAVDVRDYTFDWSSILGDDTISSSDWVADTGLTIDSDTNTTTSTTVWISGGTTNQAYRVYNTVVTTDGRTYKRFMIVLVNPVRFV